MALIDEIIERRSGTAAPVVIAGDQSLGLAHLKTSTIAPIDSLEPGRVVALVGGFDPGSIATLLRLIDRKAIVVPLVAETAPQHPHFFEAARVDTVIEGDRLTRLWDRPVPHEHLESLRERESAGLILFSSGTSGRPKAILHDVERFIARYRTSRPALRSLSFLQFDHIGGINTLLHSLFNGGTVVVPQQRDPASVVRLIEARKIELLPTTPTFLRMLLHGGLLDPERLASLRVITWGAEPMDQRTLDQCCAMLPQVDFRQTYGLSELGILRVKSKARDSLWMTVGGEGVETRIIDDVLHIRSAARMIGYLNASSPFLEGGWYDTGDVVERDDPWLRIVGRRSRAINVGGIKILPDEIERAALLHPDIAHARACGGANPITGQHIEVTCQLRPGAPATLKDLRRHFAAHLPADLRPHRIRIGPVAISHRSKMA